MKRTSSLKDSRPCQRGAAIVEYISLLALLILGVVAALQNTGRAARCEYCVAGFGMSLSAISFIDSAYAVFLDPSDMEPELVLYFCKNDIGYYDAEKCEFLF